MTEHEQDSKFTKNKDKMGNKMDIQEWIIFAIELIGTVVLLHAIGGNGWN